MSSSSGRAFLLGLDVGTGAARAVAYDLAGRQAGIGEASYRLLPAAAGAVEADPRSWREALRRAIVGLARETDLSAVVAAGLSTLYPALVAMDQEGEALRPALLYSDSRSVAQIAALRQAGRIDEIQQRTCNPVSPGTCSLTSLLWLRDNEPEVFQAAHRFGHAGTYLARWLTGQWAADPSNASLSGLFDPRTGRWDDHLARDLGPGRERLPPIVPSPQPAGRLLASVAAELGLPAAIPLAVGAGDTVCAAYGAGVVRPGQAFICSGTTDTVCLCLDNCRFDARLHIGSHAAAGRWLSLAPMSCGGGCLDWLGGLLASESPGQLLGEAEGAPPGGGGLLFLPHLRGERCPVWETGSRGVFFGLSDAAGRGEMTRAVLEGVAFALRQLLEATVEATRQPVATITLAGGPTRSNLWNQIKADILQRELVICPTPYAAARGAALLAGLAAGRVEEQAWHAEMEPAARLRPSPAAPAYESRYQAYCELERTLGPLFRTRGYSPTTGNGGHRIGAAGSE
jgi:xylulokinase